MKYRISWNEWDSIGDEKKLKFWKKIEPLGEETLFLRSAVYVPSMVEMIQFLGDGWEKDVELLIENITDSLWSKCLNNLK